MATSPIMTVMTAAVRKAARGVQRDFGEVDNLQVSLKGPGDFVTNADQRCEKILREELEKARPGYGFLMEEGGEVKGTDPENRFIIDPIDGTNNFIHAFPYFAVTIALERKGEIIAGITYNPITDEMFSAEKGGGAFMNNKRLRVAKRKDIHDTLLATYIPHRGFPGQAEARAEVAVLQAKTHGIRALGATALDMAYVAAGRLDGAWCRGLRPWDMAAGILLIKEAGGFVHDLNSDDSPLYTGGYVACNADLMPQLKAALAEAKGITGA